MLKKRRSRRPARKGKPLTVWLPGTEKEDLERLAAKTGLNQTKLVRRALALLFDAFNRGQLELGFPMQPGPGPT